MDVQIRDDAALSRISPPLLSRYLEVHDWTRDENWRGRITVWSTMRDERRFQILAPLMELSDTYAVRISEAVSTLADVEGRSQLDIYYELMAAGADVIRLRTLNGREPGRRSLSESVGLLRNAREMVRAAAHAAERPGQPVYRGRPSGAVTEYVNGVQPQPGYESGGDLILHSKVPPDYGDQTDLGDAVVRPPLARRAVLALEQGLNEAQSIAQDVIGGAGVSLFEQSVQRGVSANICDAIAALAKSQHGIGVDLSWAAIRPSAMPGRGFEFTESHAEALAGGAKLLRSKTPFLDAPVTGQIVRLDAKSREEFDGHGAVMYELDGQPIILNVQFDVADRDEVLRAFRDGTEVSLGGDIYREGNRYLLKNPRNLTVPAGRA